MLLAALATDYDGTLAHDGRIEGATIDALIQLRDSGRRVIIVTGRELPDLERVFPECTAVSDAIVAENGALLYLPATREERALGPPPPPAFVEALRRRAVSPLSVGRSIVATWEPEEHKVLEAIAELGIEWQIIFNKGAVMCLPPGVNKASGVAAAAAALELSVLNIVGVGDAENDHAFLSTCGVAVAVANALDMVKAGADLVTKGARGAGVEELIVRMIEDEAKLVAIAPRNCVELGHRPDGEPVHVSRLDAVLVAGSSGAGKSMLATALMERLVEGGRQLCVVDPEGDYEAFTPATTIGGVERAPTEDEALALLRQPQVNAVINLLGIALHDRPGFFASLAGHLEAMRAKVGRPHWLVLDEAHHLVPADAPEFAHDWRGTLALTVEPGGIATHVLAAMTAVVAVGPAAREIVGKFCDIAGRQLPRVPRAPPGDDQVWYWRTEVAAVEVLTVAPPRQEHLRHLRKYAHGELGEDKSFYFRGPEGRLNLRAQNLALFAQIADGVDDETWLYHLRRHDYSRWIADKIGDDDAAHAIAAVESDPKLDAARSRALVHEALQARYAGT
jgi:hypothetical protein